MVYVSRQMGHASPKVTLDIYAKAFNARKHADRARARMEEAFGGMLRGVADAERVSLRP